MPEPSPSPAETKPRRRAGRPVGSVLDQAGITAAALALVSKKGYDGLTMAALAKSLGVAPRLSTTTWGRRTMCSSSLKKT